MPPGGELPRDAGQGPRPPQQNRERDHGGGASHPGGQEQGPEVHRHPPSHPYCRGPGISILQCLVVEHRSHFLHFVPDAVFLWLGLLVLISVID